MCRLKLEYLKATICKQLWVIKRNELITEKEVRRINGHWSVFEKMVIIGEGKQLKTCVGLDTCYRTIQRDRLTHGFATDEFKTISFTQGRTAMIIF